MSAPADRLEQLSLDDGMSNRNRAEVRSSNGRSYDLSALNQAQAEVAYDGLASTNLSLFPMMRKAVYPEEGFVGFDIAENHHVRIPTSVDQGNRSPGRIKCDCSDFGRLRVCSHVTWLYNNVRQAMKLPDGTPERITSGRLQQRFAELASDISDTRNGPITEMINHQQQSALSKEKIDQNVMDIFAVFLPMPVAEDASSRKRPRREGDSPDSHRPPVPEIKTCLDLNREQFFSDALTPKTNIQDIIIPGALEDSMKGLARHSKVMRELLNHVVDARYRARDFVDRLRHSFDEWYYSFQYWSDKRRTIPVNFVKEMARVTRSIIANLREYDSGLRDVPDSYYDDAIELALAILGKLCGATQLEYRYSSFVQNEREERRTQYYTVASTNRDVFKAHTRQQNSSQQLPTESYDVNLFSNLLINPPPSSTRLIDDIARLLNQWSEHLTDDHIDTIRIIGPQMTEVMRDDPAIRPVATERIAPLRLLLRTHATSSGES